MFVFMLIMKCLNIIHNNTLVNHTNSYIKANLTFKTLLVSYFDFCFYVHNIVYMHMCVFF